MSVDRIQSELRAALERIGVSDVEPRLERPRDPSHGDWASNVAMMLAGRLGRPPRAIAEEIASLIPTGGGGIAAVEVAGPGFLNFRLGTDQVTSIVGEILRSDNDFGRSNAGGGAPIIVEFVSANPTGLLHLGHGRQAALGDAMSSLLEWTGWKVWREFYYNDAGRQIERLAESLRARYHQHFGRDVPIPEDGYHAETIIELAAELAASDGDRLLDPANPGEEAEALERFRAFAVERLRGEQDRDLTAFRVGFDCYYLESSLYEDGRVDRAIADLRATGLVDDRDGAVWLRTTAFEDQKDRVMVKSDGSPTYFLPDIAYHVTKWERGFRHAINIQGADHHGSTARVHAGLRALGLPEGFPEYLLHQMVTVERDGVEVKFSKRAGDYVTLRDLIEEVGTDVTRYFFLMRKPEAHLVFDLDRALDQSDRNPVYKAQYAHARMCSILRKAEEAEEAGAEAESDAENGKGGRQAGLEASEAGAPRLELLDHPTERELIRTLSTLPEMLDRAARARAPHLVCEWLEHTAGEVNAWYHAGNPTRNPALAVLTADRELRAARLALARAVRISLRNALGVLSITAPERMDRAEAVESDAESGSVPDEREI